MARQGAYLLIVPLSSSQASVLGCWNPLHSTMTGLLKRKFDQLEEDDSSSSSSSSFSSRLSLSSVPASSASPAWNSDEEGPGGQAPQSDQDSCGLQSFTRESPIRLPPTLPLLPSLKLKLAFLASVAPSGCLLL